MDDYTLSSLTESKNEWCARLVSIFTPAVIQGLKSIFQEAWNMCEENDELDKYLLTFQTFLSRVPKWNSEIIETERKRIIEVSSCGYLEDLISCVHIIQLKALTCIRVGNKQKKIDIDIPSLDKFIHQVYIVAARKIYANTYLYEKDLFPMQIQKNNRILEVLVNESILNTIRDNVPVESILRAYMEENETFEDSEQDRVVEDKVSTPEPANKIDNNKLDTSTIDVKLDEMAEKIESTPPTPSLKPIKPDLVNDTLNTNLNKSDNSLDKNENTIIDSIKLPNLTFSNTDIAVDSEGKQEQIEAPKDIETVNKIATENNAKRKAEEEDDEKLSIGDDISLSVEPISLD